ncbi:required for meiotic nuclear division protein 1 homolog [Paramacrobiotus metropolitanus]|uniref:required for meiotic nuclear division protein 1 homolog n=1 Tax=Paramacrobiotus metropolitanus TaxID=2943436 RepID=UPI0024461E11|nr:required for meiotic nuclear division protein 1 homolog [Paramacrobiotus metropolitanus]
MLRFSHSVNNQHYTILASQEYQLADSFLTEELSEDAVHYKLYEQSKPPSGQAPTNEGDVFIFSEGSVVFWNVKKDDAASFLKVLQQHAVKPYSQSIVQDEAEFLDYSFTDGHGDEYRGRPGLPSAGDAAKLSSDGHILLRKSMEAAHPQLLSLIKYAFSDAIVLSVKLAVYEAMLQEYVGSIENVAEDIKTNGRISLSKDQVLRKTGELFFLRHSINLGSNMLDPPDFYWDREDLEALYRAMCTYLNIGRRTRIFNEKLNHCYSLVELLRDHLNNQHHVRLELMIIALICVEVFFEFLHYAEKYMSTAP